MVQLREQYDRRKGWYVQVDVVQFLIVPHR